MVAAQQVEFGLAGGAALAQTEQAVGNSLPLAIGLGPMAPSMARSVNTMRMRIGQARSRSRRNRRALAAVLELQMRMNTQRVARSMATKR